MRLPRSDQIATALVAVAATAFGLWLAGVDALGMSDTRVVAAVVLGLGFVASAAAVVPGFDELLHAAKTYLVVASLLGLAALVAGVWALVADSGPMLSVLMAATVVLWVMATVRHARLAETARAAQEPPAPSAAPRAHR